MPERPGRGGPFLGRSWYAGALRTLRVEVVVVELGEDVRAGIRAAQARGLRPGTRSSASGPCLPGLPPFHRVGGLVHVGIHPGRRLRWREAVGNPVGGPLQIAIPPRTCLSTIRSRSDPPMPTYRSSSLATVGCGGPSIPGNIPDQPHHAYKPGPAGILASAAPMGSGGPRSAAMTADRTSTCVRLPGVPTRRTPRRAARRR